MEHTLDWGINVVLWFQQFSPALDVPFKMISFLGDEMFFVLLLPLIYWCIDRRTGARLTILFLFSAYVNALAKVLADMPRPFQYDSRVQPIGSADSNGFPSGHTQGAVVVWGYLASVFRKTWFWILAVLLIVLIPMSRIYLGVHFPTDLMGGYIIGIALLSFYLVFEPKIEEWVIGKKLLFQLACAIILPMILLILLPGSDKLGITAGATLMGMSIGFVLERRFVGFEASGTWGKKILRYLIGIAVLIGLRIGLSMAFKDLEPAPVFRTVRYGIMGLWGALGAPWVFILLRIADRQR